MRRIEPQSTGTDERYEFRLEFDPEPRFVSTARMFAAAVARQFSCPEERVQDLKVAISEACSNSIKAHLESGVDDPIRIVVLCEPQTLRYEILDTGGGFEVERLQRAASSDPSELIESGIGLTLIRALFPNSEILSDPRRGTLVRIAVELIDGGPQVPFGREP